MQALPVPIVPVATRRPRRVLPGFGLALGYTILYLSLVVLIPLAAIFLKTAELGWDRFVQVVSTPRVVAALELSFGAAAAAALVNSVAGLLVAWVLARCEFPLRRLVDALVDLPFALPTAVAGIALTALYAPNGPLGRILVSPNYHRIHHRLEGRQDVNLGFALTVWDQLFRTAVFPTSATVGIATGLAGRPLVVEQAPQSRHLMVFCRQLIAPFRPMGTSSSPSSDPAPAPDA